MDAVGEEAIAALKRELTSATAAHYAAIGDAQRRFEQSGEFKKATEDLKQAQRDLDAALDEANATRRNDAAARKLDAKSRLAKVETQIYADPRVISTDQVERDAQSQLELAESKIKFARERAETAAQSAQEKAASAKYVAAGWTTSGPYSPTEVAKAQAGFVDECNTSIELLTEALRRGPAVIRSSSPREKGDARARFAAIPNEIAELEGYRKQLAELPLENLRDLMIERDKRNSEQASRLKDRFGSRESAARAALEVLVKSGTIESGAIVDKDDLGQELDRQINKIACRFRYVSQSGMVRVHEGGLYFEYNDEFGIWIPWSADIDGQFVSDLTAFRDTIRKWEVIRRGGELVLDQ